MGMNLHPLLVFGALLAEGKSLDGLIDAFLLGFSAAGLPALLGGLALWLGRPRDLWALYAFVLGGITVVLASFSLRIIRAMEEGRPWFSADWPFYAAAGLPLLLGLMVCAGACRRWWRLSKQVSPRT